MLIEEKSEYLLKKTTSKAKMYEYNVPEDYHIYTEDNINELLLIAIGTIGNVANELLSKENASKVVSDERKNELEFSSKYFDSLFYSKIEVNYDNYILLLGSVAYYFCDYIGSSKVIAELVTYNELDVGCGGVDLLLLSILKDDFSEISKLNYTGSIYEEQLNKISHNYCSYYTNFSESNWDFIFDFRKLVYSGGTPRELLLVDLLLGVLLKKKHNAAINLLPDYTGLNRNDWVPILKKHILKELWPAQKKLGDSGIFAGASGVIQMPTSSGKTTSISLAIRSAFIANRTSLAVIVTPYRALSREVSESISQDFSDNDNVHVNEISDIPNDEDLNNLFSSDEDVKDILILTPEKLIFILKQNNELINEIGLIIFDEAHMFDDPSRGTNYELLLSTILIYLKPNTQKLLISAVISNAQEINQWINFDGGVVISDNTIKSTEKTIAFSDWVEIESTNGSIEYTGSLYFVDPENPEELEYHIPRTVDIRRLHNFGKERKKRLFPQLDIKNFTVRSNDMSIYYALKLNKNGGVAIFCGSKVIAEAILKRFLDIERRGINISSFIDNSNADEISKINRLISKNYGSENVYYEAGLNGIFAHHRGISNGIRISIEYAMRMDLIRCVICTSTLAQGVNLPIKYLIISNLYQAQDIIKVRDFQNLIGRVGRAGKFTEGSVILSEPFVYSKRTTDKKWRWENYKKVLDVTNTESSVSNISLLVKPTVFKNKNLSYNIDFYNLIKLQYSDPDSYKRSIEALNLQFENNDSENLENYKRVKNQILKCLSAVESHILSFLVDETQIDASIVASHTLGYHLANDIEKERIIDLFKSISAYIMNNVSGLEKRKTFNKTLLGIEQLIELDKWVVDNFYDICSCQNEIDLLKMIIPELVKYSDKKIMNTVINIDYVAEIACKWITGHSYEDIVNYSVENNVLLFKRGREAIANLNEIIDICDNGFGYSSIQIINAISEIISLQGGETESVTRMLESLCKKMRYGLPSVESINLYELGISDRYVSQLIASELPTFPHTSKHKLRSIIISNKDYILSLLEPYPRVFTTTIKNV